MPCQLWLMLPATGPLEESLLALLGRPTKLRDVAFIARTTWDRVVSGLTMEVTAATDTVPAITRPLNPTEESRIEIFRRACLLRLGIQPDHPGASGLPTMSVVPAGPGMAPVGEEEELGVRCRSHRQGNSSSAAW